MMAILFVALLTSFPIIAQAESYVESIVINVYRDGSVSLVFKGKVTPSGETTPPEISLKINSWLEFDDYVDVRLLFQMLVSQAFQGSMNFGSEFNIYYPDENSQVLNGTMSFYIDIPSYGVFRVNVTSLRATFQSQTLRYNYNGSIRLFGEGPSIGQILAYIPSYVLLLRQYIMQDPKLSRVVVINQLDVATETSSSILITFNIDFDVNQYTVLYLSPDSAQKFREAILELFNNSVHCPGRMRFYLDLSGNSLTFDYSMRIGCNIENFARMIVTSLNASQTLLNSFSSFSNYYSPYQTVSIVENENVERYVNFASDMVRDFNELFKIVPSKSSLNITLDPSGLKFEILTPRIIKKNASSPSDTLHALQDYISSSLDKLAEAGFEVNKESVMNYKVSLVAEEGVHIRYNQTEVSSLPLSELKNSTVEVESQGGLPPVATIAIVGTVIAGAVAGVLLLLFRSRGKPS